MERTEICAFFLTFFAPAGVKIYIFSLLFDACLMVQKQKRRL